MLEYSPICNVVGSPAQRVRVGSLDCWRNIAISLTTPPKLLRRDLRPTHNIGNSQLTQFLGDIGGEKG